MTNTATDTTVHIGADVLGTGGDKLGEVTRMIADARTDQVTDLVIRHGALLGKKERVVPITHVAGVEGGRVHLDLDAEGLEAMDGFAEELVGPNPDYVGPPDADLQGTYRGNMVFRNMWAAGATYAFMGGKPMGYPGGERLSPDFIQRPAVREGTAVLAAGGDKVGEVSELSVDPATGRPARITLKRGLIFKTEMELPLEWVQDLGDDGVLLNVPKDRVEALASARD